MKIIKVVDCKNKEVIRIKIEIDKKHVYSSTRDS